MMITLYSYYRSSCSWRIRLALNLKKLNYEYKAINLLQNEHRSSEYLALNPTGQVPSLFIDNHLLSESIAILEYLEECFPESRPLLPKDALNRAKVRQIVQMIASGIQPLQNLKVLKNFDDPEAKKLWAQRWIKEGFEAVEAVLKKTSRTYCVGDQVTFADIVLVPQVYNANRYEMDMTAFPTINRIHSELMLLEEFKKSHPSVQPDSPKD